MHHQSQNPRTATCLTLALIEHSPQEAGVCSPKKEEEEEAGGGGRRISVKVKWNPPNPNRALGCGFGRHDKGVKRESQSTTWPCSKRQKPETEPAEPRWAGRGLHKSPGNQ